MTLSEALIDVWKQSMDTGSRSVELEGKSYAVDHTRSQALRTVSFVSAGELIDGIEQNPLTKSNWAKLATQGRRIMQYRCRGRYIGNVCEGKLTRYPAWKALGLPE
jgi:hypothetical protein